MKTRIFGFALIAILSSLAAASVSADEHALVGNVFGKPRPAADFSLLDQKDTTFHMADTRGKVVLMAFIYTHCSDVCPFVAVKMKEVRTLLGKDARAVEFVAVTTDPSRDIPERTAAYSKAIGMYDSWHFVGGTTAAVAAVWSAYGIGVTTDPKTGAVAPEEDASAANSESTKPSPSAGLAKSDLALAGNVIQKFSSDNGYDVGDPDNPFLIVDKSGNIRVSLKVSSTPADLVGDIRALLR